MINAYKRGDGALIVIHSYYILTQRITSTTYMLYVVINWMSELIYFHL